MTIKLKDNAPMYNDCKTRHNGMVDAINEATE